MDKLWTKEQLRAFIKENNLKTADDAQQALKELFKDTIQEMLEAELETDLGYSKSEKTVRQIRIAETATVLKRCVASTEKWI